MRKLALILLLVGLSLPVMAAQEEEANVEAFGGYSYLHFDLKGAQASSSHLNGFNLAVTANLNRLFGLTGDFSAHFGGFRYGFDSAHDFSVLAGPHLHLGYRRFSPFVHALAGVTRFSQSFSVTPPEPNASSTGFTFALGGGVDYRLSPGFYVRAAQADYMLAHLFSTNRNNIRLSTGVVFKF